MLGFVFLMAHRVERRSRFKALHAAHRLAEQPRHVSCVARGGGGRRGGVVVVVRGRSLKRR